VTPDFDISLIPNGESTVETEGIDTTLVGGFGPGNAVCNDDASMITENVQIFNKVVVAGVVIIVVVVASIPQGILYAAPAQSLQPPQIPPMGGELQQ
jgi:hypothetical protein